jgi:hypothetical protein
VNNGLGIIYSLNLPPSGDEPGSLLGHLKYIFLLQGMFDGGCVRFLILQKGERKWVSWQLFGWNMSAKGKIK